MERHVNPEDPDLYALGALDGEEKRAFEAHLRTCAPCAAELAAARERVALLAFAAPPVVPPPALKENLLRRARAERPPTSVTSAAAAPAALPTRKPTPPRPTARRPLFSWLTPVFAAATLFFAVLA